MTATWKRQLGFDRPSRGAGTAEVEPLGIDLDLATVVALHQRSHDRRAARLRAAWRLTVAVWAALLLTALFGFDSTSVASTLQQDRWIVTALGAGLVVLVILHGWYLAAVAAAADADRADAVRLEQLAGLPISADRGSRAVGSLSAGRWLLVWMTALLAAAVVLAAAAAAPPLPCTTVTQDGTAGSATTITCPSPAAGT